MSKDYYKSLGLEKGASADEIKKAFRKKAHEYHPDKKGGDEAKFKEINEAYQILGDEQKRKQYDQYGSDFESQGGFGGGMNWDDFMRATRGQGGQGGFGGQAGGFNFNFGGVDLGDIFGDFFGGGGGGQGRTQRGRDVQVDIELEFKEAVFGVEKEIRLMKNNHCDVCTGSGQEPGSKMMQCGECKGKGQVQQVQRTIFGAMQTVVQCYLCHGTGQIPEKSCKHCGGKGVTKSESKYNVKIPEGIHDGATIRLDGKGESGGVGSVPGSLYVVVHIKADKTFTREGDDIHSTIHISFPEAALGTEKEIETLDGKKKIKIPDGTQSKEKIRFKHEGVPHLRSSGRGDHYVEVIVDVPKHLSRSAKKLLEELQQELN